MAENQIGEPDVAQFGERMFDWQNFRDTTLPAWRHCDAGTKQGKDRLWRGLESLAIWSLDGRCESDRRVQNVQLIAGSSPHPGQRRTTQLAPDYRIGKLNLCGMQR